MKKFALKLIKGIIIFILCGFSYSMVKDNVIPNIKNRLYPEPYLYHVFIDNGDRPLHNYVLTKKPWFDKNVFYFYDKYDNLVSLMNYQINVIEVKGDNSF